MNNDMKCPFCQQELEQITTSNPLGLGRIEMAVCKKCMDKGVLHIMPIWDWQELIRTHKALDVAVDALKSAHDYYEYCIQRDKEYGSDDINWDCIAMNMDNDISEALEQITALEQKEVK